MNTDFFVHLLTQKMILKLIYSIEHSRIHIFISIFIKQYGVHIHVIIIRYYVHILIIGKNLEENQLYLIILLKYVNNGKFQIGYLIKQIVDVINHRYVENVMD